MVKMRTITFLNSIILTRMTKGSLRVGEED